MEYLPPCQMDDLLDFSSDIGEAGDEEEDVDQTKTLPPSLPFHSKRGAAVNSFSSSFPGFVEEEELEWISNKDAFPMVESFADFLPNQHPLAPALGIPATSAANHRSPVSVLENSSSTSLNSSGSHSSNNNNNISISCGSGGAISGLMLSISSSLKAPSRTRSKRRRKKRKDLSEWPCWTPQSHGAITSQKGPAKQRAGGSKPSSILGRKCQHCQTEKTPQWRAGPMGPKTLCNACGVRYKSGRLVPEYRPASSPTFSSELHSNSHRKIVEMRKRSIQGTTMMESGLKPLGSA